jgi:hypothetical protein
VALLNSPEGIDCPLANIPDGLYNMSIALGEPYNLHTFAVFAKITPMSAAVLEIMFPPTEGYLFGKDVEPFLQLYIQDSDRSLTIAGTTASSAKSTSCYVELIIEPDSQARSSGAEAAVVWHYNPNSRKIFLGQYIKHEGGYSITARVFDLLKRDTGAHANISLSLSLAGDSPLACTPGATSCAPQAVAPPEEREWTSVSKLAAAVAKNCPELDARDALCGSYERQSGAGVSAGESHAESGGMGIEDSRKDCSGRGTCLGGVCYCHQDVIGARCEHQLLKDLSFLPDLHPLDDPARCHRSIALQRGAQQLLEKLVSLQYPRTCEGSKLSQRRFNKTQGLGVTLRWLGLSQLEALKSERTLVVGGRWRAFNFDGCDERGLWCYLAPITNCSVQVWDWEDVERKDFEMPQVVRVPDPRMDQGQLWWSATTLHAIMRPSLDFQAVLRRVKLTMGWGGRVLGLHVRHGDSCADVIRKQCIHSDRYFAEAEAVASRYNMDAIFVATDDPQVAHSARKRQEEAAEVGEGEDAGGARGKRIKYLLSPAKRELFANHMYIEHRLNLGVVDRKGVSDGTFIDLFLLRDCDALVGTFGSHFSKVGYELSVAEKGWFPPYVSLDEPWQPLRPIAPNCEHPQCLEQ